MSVIETGHSNAYGIAEIDTYVREYAWFGSTRYDGSNMTVVYYSILRRNVEEQWKRGRIALDHPERVGSDTALPVYLSSESDIRFGKPTTS